MKTIVINNDRSSNVNELHIGYNQEHKIEDLQFIFPEYLSNLNTIVNFRANDKTLFSKLLENNTLVITNDITQYNSLDMIIKFFDTDDNIVAKTQIIKLLIDDSIPDSDVTPDNPQVILLNTLISKVNDLIEQAESGDLNGATFIPSVSDNGILSWTNDKNLKNPNEVNIKGPKGDVGPRGDVNFATFSLRGKSLYLKRPDNLKDIEFKVIGKQLGVKIA